MINLGDNMKRFMLLSCSLAILNMFSENVFSISDGMQLILSKMLVNESIDIGKIYLNNILQYHKINIAKLLSNRLNVQNCSLIIQNLFVAKDINSAILTYCYFLKTIDNNSNNEKGYVVKCTDKKSGEKELMGSDIIKSIFDDQDNIVQSGAYGKFGVCPIIGSFEDKELFWELMNEAPGLRADQWLERNQNKEDIEKIFLLIGESLYYFHKHDVSHGDFHLGNIKISAENQIFIFDFGCTEKLSGSINKKLKAMVGDIEKLFSLFPENEKNKQVALESFLKGYLLSEKSSNKNCILVCENFFNDSNIGELLRSQCNIELEKFLEKNATMDKK